MTSTSPVSTVASTPGAAGADPAAAAEPGLDRVVRVDGVDVRYGVSGAGEHDLVLVHGHGAHHRWWHAMVPLLEPSWRVIQLELTGHGDSGHRPLYTADVWTRDVLAVLDAAGSRRPVLVGHSMGGIVLVSVAAAHPDRAAGLVLLDASVRPPHRHRGLTEDGVRLSRPGEQRPHGQPTQEALLGRFRLMPPQPHPPAALLDPAARFSCRHTEHGWTWKHDRLGVTRLPDADAVAAAGQLRCPVGLVYGTESTVVDRECLEFMAGVVPGGAEIVAVPGAHHHLVLERPETCAEVVHRMATGFLDGR
jgi:pimeloyl-ACP methyl ester carboxylesterase